MDHHPDTPINEVFRRRRQKRRLPQSELKTEQLEESTRVENDGDQRDAVSNASVSPYQHSPQYTPIPMNAAARPLAQPSTSAFEQPASPPLTPNPQNDGELPSESFRESGIEDSTPSPMRDPLAKERLRLRYLQKSKAYSGQIRMINQEMGSDLPEAKKAVDSQIRECDSLFEEASQADVYGGVVATEDIHNIQGLSETTRKLCIKSTKPSSRHRFNWKPLQFKLGNSNKDDWSRVAKYLSLKTKPIPPSFSALNTFLPDFDTNPEPSQKRQRQPLRNAEISDVARTPLESARVHADGYQLGDTQQINHLIIEQCYAAIIKLFKNQGATEMDYMRVVVDSRDFGHTVENMFHVDFLIYDEMLGLRQDRKGRLWLFIPEKSRHLVERMAFDTAERQQPSTSSEPSIKITRTRQYKSMQGILSLTMEDWRNIVKALNLNGVENCLP